MKIFIFLYIPIFGLCLNSCNIERTKSDNYEKSNHVEIDQFSSMILNNVFNDNIRFPPSYQITDVGGNRIELKSLFRYPKIIIRLQESYCESCIVEQIELINSVIQAPNEKVIAFATYNNIRKLRIFVDKYKINFPIYFIPNDESDLLFSNKINDDYFQPFYFLLDSSLISKYQFYPDIYFTETTSDYLKRCEKIITESEKNKHTLSINNGDLYHDDIKITNTSDIVIGYTNMTNERMYIDSVSIMCDCMSIIGFNSVLEQSTDGELILKYNPVRTGFDQKEITFFIRNNIDIHVRFMAYVSN